MSVTNAEESHAIKKKGCDFQEEIVTKILSKIPSLTVADVVSCPPSCKGEDAQISNDARRVLPIVVECKHYAGRLHQWHLVSLYKSEPP